MLKGKNPVQNNVLEFAQAISVQIYLRLSTWDELDRRRRPNVLTNLAQLRNTLHEEWDNIPIARINIMMNSMHRKMNKGCDNCAKKGKRKVRGVP